MMNKAAERMKEMQRMQLEFEEDIVPDYQDLLSRDGTGNFDKEGASHS